MTPDTAERWANEMHLSPNERKIWRLFGTRGEATIAEMIGVVYGDREDGGPLRANDCIRQLIHALRRKLGERGTIDTVHLFELRLHSGRRSSGLTAERQSYASDPIER